MSIIVNLLYMESIFLFQISDEVARLRAKTMDFDLCTQVFCHKCAFVFLPVFMILRLLHADTKTAGDRSQPLFVMLNRVFEKY